MRRAVAALAIATLLVGVAVAGTATRIAAHRGGAALAPENSLAAFRNAIALGADALEFDVHLTANGELVVIHDAALERTTTGIGAVADATLAELHALRLKSRDLIAARSRLSFCRRVTISMKLGWVEVRWYGSIPFAWESCHVPPWPGPPVGAGGGLWYGSAPFAA